MKGVIKIKTELITNIMNAMHTYLDDQQRDKLKDILYLSLHEYDVTQRCTDIVLYNHEDNERYINLFLGFKRIGNRKESTLNYYEIEIRKLLNFLNKKVSEITTEDIGYYLAWYKMQDKSRKHPVSPSTLDTLRRIYNSFFSWLLNNGYVRKNPISLLEKGKIDKKIKKPFTEEELQLIRNACKDIRTLAMVDFLTASGVRVSEFCSVNITDIDWSRKELIVTGKGNKQRTVYLNATALISVQRYLETRTDDNPSLFVSKNKPYNRLKPGAVRNVLHELEQATGTYIHPHKFRRTLATRLLERGMKIEHIQKILGHEKIETTLIYCSVSQTDVKYEYTKFGTF